MEERERERERERGQRRKPLRDRHRVGEKGEQHTYTTTLRVIRRLGVLEEERSEGRGKGNDRKGKERKGKGRKGRERKKGKERKGKEKKIRKGQVEKRANKVDEPKEKEKEV